MPARGRNTEQQIPAPPATCSSDRPGVSVSPAQSTAIQSGLVYPRPLARVEDRAVARPDLVDDPEVMNPSSRSSGGPRRRRSAAERAPQRISGRPAARRSSSRPRHPRPFGQYAQRPGRQRRSGISRPTFPAVPSCAACTSTVLLPHLEVADARAEDLIPTTTASAPRSATSSAAPRAATCSSTASRPRPSWARLRRGRVRRLRRGGGRAARTARIALERIERIAPAATVASRILDSAAGSASCSPSRASSAGRPWAWSRASSPPPTRASGSAWT